MPYEPNDNENVGVHAQFAVGACDSPISPELSERLGFLTEELGESLQMVGKIIRHGIDSSHPDYGDVTNRDNLAKELGHAQAIMKILMRAGDISADAVDEGMMGKFVRLSKFTHHPVNRDLIQACVMEATGTKI